MTEPHRRLLAATLAMAQHTGNLQQRLAEAYSAHLAADDLQHGLPEDLRPRFAYMRARLTYAGNPEISTRLLDDTEAHEFIAVIVGLAWSTATPAPGGLRLDRRYALEKLTLATQELAVSTESRPERLAGAYMFQLMPLQATDVSEAMWSRLEALRARLTREQPRGDEGTVQATVRQMTEEEARELISQIVELYGQIAREAGR
jgi:hypothetical protein